MVHIQKVFIPAHLDWYEHLLDGAHPEGVHTSPSELAQIVEEINPSKIVLTHVSPEVVAIKDKVIEIVSRRTNAEVVLGEDLMEIDL